MNLLTPLGLLGLISIAVLILIYIIRPNYQQKVISSTYVWQLSLKYKKKRLPINRLRNIILIICQVLILASCAFILAQPIINEAVELERAEKVAILDASASMRVKEGMALSGDSTVEDTRFERAVEQIRALAEEAVNDGGAFSLILADAEPKFLIRQAGKDMLSDINDTLDALIKDDGDCSYGTADIDAAVMLAENVLVKNAGAQVVLYTDADYTDSGYVKVVNVANEGEWNAAILNVTATVVDNYYTFTADVACYGKNQVLPVYCEVNGVNDSDKVVEMNVINTCNDDKTVQYVFDKTVGDAIYSFDSAQIYVQVDDNFSADNVYNIYGGTKETVRVQYASSLPNIFFDGILMGLRDDMKNEWNIEVDQLQKGETPELKNRDIYIFEHTMPENIPTDGIVFLIDMDKAPLNAGFALGSEVQGRFHLDESTEEHPMTQYLNTGSIEITRYKRILSYDGYEPLMYCGGDPILLVKNKPDEKVVVLSLNLNYSDFALRPDFSFFMYNFFNYFLTSTVDKPVYEVGESVKVNARGTDVKFMGPDIEEDLSTFPCEIRLKNIGTYSVLQKLISGEQVNKNIFVKVPASESNIHKSGGFIISNRGENDSKDWYDDLLVYFAAALVALSIIEWILQAREYF